MFFIILKPSCIGHSRGGVVNPDQYPCPKMTLIHSVISSLPNTPEHDCYLFQGADIYEVMNVLFLHLNRGSVHKPAKIKELFETASE